MAKEYDFSFLNNVENKEQIQSLFNNTYADRFGVSGKYNQNFDGETINVHTYDGRIKAAEKLGLDLTDRKVVSGLNRFLKDNRYVRSKTYSEGDLNKNSIRDNLAHKIREQRSHRNLESLTSEEDLSDTTILRPSFKKRVSSYLKKTIAAAAMLTAVTLPTSCENGYGNNTLSTEQRESYEELKQKLAKLEVKQKRPTINKPIFMSLNDPLSVSLETALYSNSGTQTNSNENISTYNTQRAEVSDLSETKLRHDLIEIQEEKSQNLEQDDSRGSYRRHVDFRNFQLRDSTGDGISNDVSANPRHLGRSLRNHGTTYGETLSDKENFGYKEGKTKSRLRNIGRMIVSPVDSVLGFVSGGKWGLHEDNIEARKDNNFILGSIMSLGDGVQSITRGIVDTPDFLLGGVANKVVYDVIGGGFKGIINSTVDVGNYALAIPIDGLQRFENWALNNQGKVSMELYELATTLTRFSGNVILHEAPFDGEYVQVRDEFGNQAIISKGQRGATLESLVALLKNSGLASTKSGSSSVAGSSSSKASGALGNINIGNAIN